MPRPTYLQAADLLVARDGRVLFRGLGLSVEGGRVLRVEGPNGAGKTTLLRVLAGLDQDYEGRIDWPAATAEGRPWREDVLFLGHLPGIKGALSPAENLDWLVRLRGRVPRCAIADALARVGLRGFEDVPSAQLSAGQRRRVALARLHLEDAPVWILDEPFTAIDRSGVRELEALLAAHAEGGGAVVVTTHHELALARDVESLVLGRAA